MSQIEATVFGMALGIIAGIPLAIAGEFFLKYFRRRDFIKHINADLNNIYRHFSLDRDEIVLLNREPTWKQKCRIQWLKFSHRNFLTHDKDQYILLSNNELNEISKFLFTWTILMLLVRSLVLLSQMITQSTMIS